MIRSKISRILLFFSLATFFVLFFSKSTSPIYSNAIGIDSAIFMIVGKGWTSGMLPYVDLWDSKGPIIFAINSLGWIITGNRYGIFAIQVVCASFTSFFVFKTLAVCFSEKTAYILTIILFFLLRLNYVGNSTEEFLLPLLCFSFWKLLEFVKQPMNDELEHKPKYAFLYGVTFSFCLLTRLTNALGLSGAVLVIMVVLIKKRKWDNLFKNAISFILGILLLLAPFLVYFYSKGAMYDFLYGTIIYNIDYLTDSNLKITNLYALAKIILRFGISLILPIIGFLEVLERKEECLHGWVWIVSGLLMMIWFLNSRGYEHYGMVAFPYYAISLVEVTECCKRSLHKTAWKRVQVLLCCFFFTVAVGSTIFTKNEIVRYINSKETERQRIIADVLSVIPQEERDSFVAYNVNPNVYLFLDIQPCYRFFALQDKQVSVSESMKEMLWDTFSQKTAKWILFVGNPNKSFITDIIKEDYVLDQRVYCKGTNEIFSLYTLRQN